MSNELIEYTVLSGDNLSKIALLFYGDKNLYHLIKQLNALTSDVIHPGLKLKLKPKKTENLQVSEIVVKRGDSLWKIAKDKGITLDKLLRDNNLNLNSVIHPGLKLKLIKRISKPSKKTMTTDEIYDYESQYNKLSDIDIINGWHKKNDTGIYYIIDDKKNDVVGIYLNGVLIKSYPAIHGKNRELDDMTKTYVDKRGNIINGAGNMSTPAGYYLASYSGQYHGAPSYIRLTLYMVDLGYKDGIPSSMHQRFVTKGANTNGCTGMECSSLIDMHNYLQNLKYTDVYILPVEEKNRFYVRNNLILFRSNDVTLTPAHNTFIYNPIKKIVFDSKLNSTLEPYQRTLLKRYLTSAISNKEKLQKDLGINDDTYDKLAKAAIGILGVETTYGVEHNAIGNAARVVQKAIGLSLGYNVSSPDYRSKYYTYGVDGDNNSVGLTQIRMSLIRDPKNEEEAKYSVKAKTLYRKYGITKDALVNDPQKAFIATIIKLADEYKRRGQNIDAAIKGWNNKPMYLNLVNDLMKHFQFYKDY